MFGETRPRRASRSRCEDARRHDTAVRSNSAAHSAAFLRFVALHRSPLGTPPLAFAHASDRGHVLLLPTGYYLVGGAVAVAASFLVLTVLRPKPLERISRRGWSSARSARPCRAAAQPRSSFAILAVLIAAGFFGSRDPLSNPLPLTVWTLLWVGLTLVQGVFGNLWAWINPWYGPWRAVSALLGRARSDPPPKRLPEWLGYWPAVLLLLGFAWFELVYPAPDDPARLAWAVGALLVLQLRRHAGVRLRRLEQARRVPVGLLRHGVALRHRREAAGERRPQPARPLPARREARGDAAAAARAARCSCSLALGSVSFDGLSKTFFWLGANGINPLEFPGRSALDGINSARPAADVRGAGRRLSALRPCRRAAGRQPARFGIAAGLLVWSIVPIALAYHFSHYLTALAGQRPVCAGGAVRSVLARLEPVRHGASCRSTPAWSWAPARPG